MRVRDSTLLLMALLAGCASYSGSSLVPGQASIADVEATMGRPAMRVSKPDGTTVLYYPRGPAGRQSYAAVLGPDGKLKAVEQRLTDENIAKIVLGTTTEEQVRELLGPPPTVTRLPRIARDVWEYKIGTNAMPYVLWVQFSYDGIAREVFKARDPEIEGKSGPSRW